MNLSVTAPAKADPASVFDAMDTGVTAAEVAARLHAINEEASRRRFEARAADYLEQLRRKFGDAS